MAKPIQRKKARILRQKGTGIKTIAHKLQVSSSTVSLWCRDIVLTQEQINELERRSRDPYYGRRLSYVRKQQKKRLLKTQRLLKQGIRDVGTITNRELFVAGICLYWAEGFKKDRQVGFANSDPEMVQFFIQWLEDCCDIGKDRLKLRVGVNENYKEKISTIESYWSGVTGIPRDKFQKPYFQKVQWKKTYDNPDDYHGVLRIRVSKSADFLRKIHGWIAGMKTSYKREEPVQDATDAREAKRAKKEKKSPFDLYLKRRWGTTDV